MKRLLVCFALIIVLTACAPKAEAGTSEPSGAMGAASEGMSTRHHTPIPQEYAGLKNPVPADDASLERGKNLYATSCASCHGDGGMGDGPAGATLIPQPAPVAHTSQMMADAYLFWRISEGGAEFGTTMPAWKSLDEQSRWDMINYMRALGAGTTQPGSSMGGAAYNSETQAARQDELLAKAVEQGVVSQAEADTFKLVHDATEQYRVDHPELVNEMSDANQREAAILAALVEAKTITQTQADAFGGIHDRLGAAGLMP